MDNPEKCSLCNKTYVHCENFEDGRKLMTGWQKETITFHENPIIECKQRIELEKQNELNKQKL